jgi:hypothetical protein
MAEMGVARVADSFHPLQKARSVEMVRNDVGGYGLRKGRPTRTGLKFLACVEQDRVAADAGIDSRLKQATHLRTESALGPGLPRDSVLFGAQLLTPFGICLFDSAIRCRIAIPG